MTPKLIVVLSHETDGTIEKRRELAARGMTGAAYALGLKRGTEELPRPSTMTSIHARRLKAALEAYRNNPASKIVVTIGDTVGVYLPVNGQPMHERSARWLVRHGVPLENILRIPNARWTAEEIAGMKSILAEHRPDTVLLVSSNFHFPRALKMFHAAYPRQQVETIEVPEETDVVSGATSRDVRIARQLRRARNKNGR